MAWTPAERVQGQGPAGSRGRRRCTNPAPAGPGPGHRRAALAVEHDGQRVVHVRLPGVVPAARYGCSAPGPDGHERPRSCRAGRWLTPNRWWARAWAARSPSRCAAARAHLLGGHPVVPAALRIPGTGQRPGDLPRVRVEACLQGPRRRGHQDLVLGVEPGQSLPRHRPMCSGVDAGLGRGQRDRPAGGVQRSATRVRGVQVVVEHPAHGRVPLGLAVGRLGQLGGVGAEQVMAREPAGGVLGQQVRPGQLAQPAARLGQAAGRPGWPRPRR